MINETTKPTYELIDVLESIKSSLEFVNDNRSEREKVIETYRSTILPNLLKIRLLNRISKDKLEEKYHQIRIVEQQLVNLHNTWENLTFEAAYLRHQVTSAKERLSPRKQSSAFPKADIHKVNDSDAELPDPKDDYFDPDIVSKLDHEQRTKVLELEESKRRQLCDRLSEMTSETNEIDLLCQASEQEISRVKPYIKQLLDKVDTGQSDSVRPEKESP